MAQSAFAVTQDNQVIYLDSDGYQVAISPTNFARSVTCDADGTVWVVSTDYGPKGNVIKYYQGFPSTQSKWESLDKSLGAVQVVGRSLGHCVFRAPDGSVHLADTGGGHTQVTKRGAANFVAALGFQPIYILTNKVVSGGSVIRSTSDEGQTWQIVPNGEAAKATEIFVQVYNNVAFLNNDGAVGYMDATMNNKIHLVSPPDMALALGISAMNTWWIVSTDADIQTGGNFLKYWDGGGFDASNWKTTTPPIPGIAIGPR